MKNIRSTLIHSMKTLLLITVLLSLSLLFANSETEERFGIKFSPLSPISLPEISEVQLKNGMTLMLSENHDFPTISISVLVRGGTYYEPEDKIGMVDIATELLRSGGTKSYSVDKLNNLLENNAIDLSTNAGLHSSVINMNFLADDIDLALEVLNEVLRYPQFSEESIEREKRGYTAEIARRNDEISSITSREYMKLVFGKDHPYARTYEYHTLANIEREDLISYHQRFFKPNNVILSVVGDFKTKTLKKKIEKTFGKWQKDKSFTTEEVVFDVEYRPSVNLIDLEDAQQAWIAIGHITEMTQRDSDYVPMLVLNSVLGAPFSGRIFNRIRNQQGLAYAPTAYYSVFYDFPGVFYLMSQTRNDKTATAIKALIEEVRILQNEYITEEELSYAKESFLNSFVFNYTTTDQIVRRQMSYKYWNYPSDFLEQVRRMVDKVTVEDIHRVAKEYLYPDKFVILVAGNSEEFDYPLDTLGEVNEIDIDIPRPERGRTEPTQMSMEIGREIFNQYLTRMGDVGKVNNIYLEGKSIEYRGSESSSVELKIFIELPDKIKQSISTPNGDLSMVYNSGKTAMLIPGNKRMELPREFTADLVSNLYSNPIFLANSPEDEYFIYLVEEKQIEDKSFYILAFSDGYDQYLLFIDSETMLPYQSVQERIDMSGEIVIYNVFESYQNVDGIEYPNKIVTRNEQGQTLAELEFTEIKFNVDFPEDTFKTE